MNDTSLVVAVISIILFLILPAVMLVGLYIYVFISSIRENLKSEKVNEPIKDIPDKKENIMMVVAETVDIDNYKRNKKVVWLKVPMK